MTEVYTGARYELVSDPEQTTVIVAKDIVAVDFENDYNKEDIGGHGAVNSFEPEEGGWHWERKPSSKIYAPEVE